MAAKFSSVSNSAGKARLQLVCSLSAPTLIAAAAPMLRWAVDVPAVSTYTLRSVAVPSCLLQDTSTPPAEDLSLDDTLLLDITGGRRQDQRA